MRSGLVTAQTSARPEVSPTQSDEDTDDERQDDISMLAFSDAEDDFTAAGISHEQFQAVRRSLAAKRRKLHV